MKRTLLSVDDSMIIRKIMRGAAEVLDFEFLEASDGFDALRILETEYEKVSLVLLDWNMPGMNGFEVLQTIKTDERFRSIPVMMVTTESEKENIIMSIQAGAIHYMVKPFTMEELTKRIMECFGEGS